MPSFDGGDDFGWVCSPCEGLWIIVGFIEEAFDRSLEFADRSEDAALEASFGEFGEEAFDGVEPR